MDSRVIVFTDNAYSCDPRVKKFKEIEREKKEAQKRAKEEAAKEEARKKEEVCPYVSCDSHMIRL